MKFNKKFIVTTTIFPPTQATLKYIQKDWQVIIVGDLKTPHESYKKLQKTYQNVLYLSPNDQEKIDKNLSDAIGWNKIMRRNMGFCLAYKNGAELIASIDDDNIPYENWGEKILVGETAEIDCWESENGVFDPLSITNVNYLWHRGYPSELIPSRLKTKYLGKIKRDIRIQADLWDGVPDVDAMNRIIFNPRIKLNITDPFCSPNISPFNSQNVFLSAEILPYYMVLPYVGRFDDIWGSYLVQKQFPDSLIFNKATVYQDRHEPPSRNIKDLRDEILGYENTLKLIKNQYKLPERTQKAYNLYQRFFD